MRAWFPSDESARHETTRARSRGGTVEQTITNERAIGDETKASERASERTDERSDELSQAVVVVVRYTAAESIGSENERCSSSLLAGRSTRIRE